MRFLGDTITRSEAYVAYSPVPRFLNSTWSRPTSPAPRQKALDKLLTLVHDRFSATKQIP